MAATLIDVYGRPIVREVLKDEQAGVTTRLVRRRDSMHPAAGLTPPKLAALLRDSIEADPENYLALAEGKPLLQGAQLGSVLGSIKIAVQGCQNHRPSRAEIRAVVHRDDEPLLPDPVREVARLPPG